MGVQKIESAVTISGLDDWGVAGADSGRPSKLSGSRVQISGREEINAGVFECTAGEYRRFVVEAEVMHFIAGGGSFTLDNEVPIIFKAGDTFFFQNNTRGLWKIDETMRKIYVIF